ncbi:hypothetical protein ACH44C_00790 [Streptomyces purpureus]|uniref:hypothetical protein n=1 Tax=Streptomyces purpureus TaxID=1951 RepID=UPI00378FD53F
MAFLLLFLVPAGLVATLWLAGYGVGSLGRYGLRHAGREVWLRSVAALLGAVAAAMYTWGLLHVTWAVMEAEDGGTNSAPIRPCRTAGWQDRTTASMISDYTVSFLPLRFVCRTNDGGRHATDTVPGHVNPSVLTFAMGAAVCVGVAALGSERRIRKNAAD